MTPQTKPAPQPGQILEITVEGVKYVLDLAQFSGRETGILKRVGELRGVAEIPAALAAGDLEAVVALAVIAARRAGVTLDADRLLDAEMGAVRVHVVGEEADEANPPAEPLAAEPEADGAAA